MSTREPSPPPAPTSPAATTSAGSDRRGFLGRVATALGAGVVAGHVPSLAHAAPADPPQAHRERTACLDFTLRFLVGPRAGTSLVGDLLMHVANDGLFAAYLVPAGERSRETLDPGDASRVIARGYGQVNGLSVSWIIHFPDGPVTGTGQFDPVVDAARPNPVLRGTSSGPGDEIAAFHGSSRPPYIRTICVDCY